MINFYALCSSCLVFHLFLILSFSSVFSAEDKFYKHLEQDERKNEKDSLTLQQIASLFMHTKKNNIADLDKIEKYDPQGIIGFCFGRAMTAHLVARSMGLKSSSIKKLFIIGDLRQGENPEWRFHVTTVVQGPNNIKYAIDPLFERPQKMKAWIEAVRKIWDKSKTAKLYLTSSQAIIPDLRIVEADPKNENGAKIIHLNFAPLGHEGFSPSIAEIKDVYDVASSVEGKFFSQWNEDSSTRFNFVQIKINEELISYGGYFTDLFDDILAQVIASNYPHLNDGENLISSSTLLPVHLRRANSEEISTGPYVEEKSINKNLGSIHFGKLLKHE